MTVLPALLPLLLPDWLDPEYLIHALGNWALWGVALILIVIVSVIPMGVEYLLARRRNKQASAIV